MAILALYASHSFSKVDNEGAVSLEELSWALLHLSQPKTAAVSSITNMKGFLLASLAALAVAAPSSKKTGQWYVRAGWLACEMTFLDANSQRAAPVTAQQLNNFKLYMQWSSASHCANEAPIGSVVTCTDNQCSMFQSHNATVAATFMYVCSYCFRTHTVWLTCAVSGSILDMRGFLGIDDVDKNIVLSFRGSTSWRNWIAE
jgi:hypothetical protein